MVEKRILKNNVVLLTECVERARSVAIGFYFLSAGSRYEGEGQGGISHFCEHLLFKGAGLPDGKELSTHDIACIFDRMGGYVNAFTERDDVCAYCTVPALGENLRTAVKTFCALASSCTFPAHELENERTVVQNEIRASYDDSEESALDSLADFMFPAQGLGRSITGSVQDVASLTRENLLAWYEERFVHGELVVSVAGAVSKEDSEFILESLGALPVHAEPCDYPAALRASEKAVWNAGTTFRNDRRFGQCQMYELYTFPVPPTHSSLSVLTVLNALTGDAMSSRLFETLREKNGCCYSTYSFSTCYEDVAFWGAAASCDRHNALKVADLMHGELLGLLKNPPDEAEVERAKEHVLGEEYLSGDDTESLMKRNLRHYAMGLPLITGGQVCDGIRAVQKNAIMDFVQNILLPQNRVFFVYGPRLGRRVKREILCRIK